MSESHVKSKIITFAIIVLILIVSWFTVQNSPILTLNSDNKTSNKTVITNQNNYDWQSFVRVNDGFTIRYPTIFRFTDLEESSRTTSDNQQTIFSLALDDDSAAKSISMGMTIHQGAKISDLQSASMQNYKIGDINALKDEYVYQRGDLSGPKFYNIRIIFGKNNKVYDIYAEIDDPPSTSDINLVNSIISTISFTDTKTYVCPPTGYVDCMPSPDGSKASCSKEAMAWYEANCDGFKGGAL